MPKRPGVYSGDDGYYEFDILKAGSASTDPGDAKPQGGRTPLPNRPVGNAEIDPQGHLADIRLQLRAAGDRHGGGATVAVGTGADFVVRRRKATGTGSPPGRHHSADRRGRRVRAWRHGGPSGLRVLTRRGTQCPDLSAGRGARGRR
ncbi:hypothetical protein [Streptomyces afghaniensis]|uniref:hypothetical protein n=1 Tax=Streptomyces afghaniensis TaxID=66865 RepID=UPI002785B741|nr:hypothetical protein [Streptomyces afghaniensis]MDQ1014131.1 hypothetical protein [Streptomyces afghaniensis]